MIQPDGFAGHAEFEADRAQHLAAVRRAFAEMDIFIFTLGLTEIWESVEDGAVFPLCPGAPRGVFDPARYRLRNLTVDENVADLTAFLDRLREVNPGARVILTVSPVPLVATAEAGHVLTATTLSKSVLRVAADIVCRTGAAAYFPAYEIVTGVHARGAYFADDCRSVTELGVDHVMRVFFRHAAEDSEMAAEPKLRPVFDAGGAFVQVVCEEESLDEGK
jgi:hypothetical protein